MQVDIEILEILRLLRVLLGSYVQNMCDSMLNQFLHFESRHKVTVAETRLNLNQLESLKETIVFAATEGRVWEPVTINVFIVLVVDQYSLSATFDILVIAG